MIATLSATSPVVRTPPPAPGPTKASADVGAADKVAAMSDDSAVTLTTPPALLAAQGAPIDAAKVAAIRAQIAGGSYKIDPAAIAARMIAEDLPLRG